VKGIEKNMKNVWFGYKYICDDKQVESIWEAGRITQSWPAECIEVNIIIRLNGGQ
jgi:hypothetical protein